MASNVEFRKLELGVMPPVVNIARFAALRET